MPNLIRIHLVSLAVAHLFVLSLSWMRFDSHSPFRSCALIHVHLFIVVLLQPLKFTSGLAFQGQGGIGRVDGGTWILPTWGVTSRGGGGDQLGHGVACSAGLHVAIGGIGLMTVRMPCASMCVAICSTATSLGQCCTLCCTGLKMKTKGPLMAGLGDRCLGQGVLLFC